MKFNLLSEMLLLKEEKTAFEQAAEKLKDDAKKAFDYAEKNNKPYPEGEKAIAGDAEYAFQYAKFILEGPFPIGEDVILQNPEYAFRYATSVLKKPWPKGEDIIASNLYTAIGYANFLPKKQKFPKGEPIISTNAEYAYDYAKKNGPWPNGSIAEKTISHSSKWEPKYLMNILKDQNKIDEFKKRYKNKSEIIIPTNNMNDKKSRIMKFTSDEDEQAVTNDIIKNTIPFVSIHNLSKN